MSDHRHEPTDADGPLFRAAYRAADQVDTATTPEQRRKAWGGFVRAGLVALAEGLLREAMVWGAVLFSVLAAVFGATAGDRVWAGPMIVSGLVGVALVLVSHWRKWSFGRQWLVLLGVTIVQIGLIVALWRTH